MSLLSILLVFLSGQQVPQPRVPGLLLAVFPFEQAVLRPPPWQHVELRLPAGSSFLCPCLSLRGLISPDDLSQPQQGPSVASPPLSQVSTLRSHDGHPLRRDSMSSHQFSFFYFSFLIQPYTTFPPVSSQSPAVAPWGFIITLLCSGTCRVAMILFLTSSLLTNIKKKPTCFMVWKMNKMDKSELKLREKIVGLLPGYPAFSSLCCWTNCTHRLDVSVCYYHTVTVYNIFSQIDLKYVPIV